MQQNYKLLHMNGQIDTRAITYLDPDDFLSVNYSQQERSAITLGIELWNFQQQHLIVT